jgi:hypothetical protein
MKQIRALTVTLLLGMTAINLLPLTVYAGWLCGETKNLDSNTTAFASSTDYLQILVIAAIAFYGASFLATRYLSKLVSAAKKLRTSHRVIASIGTLLLTGFFANLYVLACENLLLAIRQSVIVIYDDTVGSSCTVYTYHLTNQTRSIFITALLVSFVLVLLFSLKLVTQLVRLWKS